MNTGVVMEKWEKYKIEYGFFERLLFKLGIKKNLKVFVYGRELLGVYQFKTMKDMNDFMEYLYDVNGGVTINQYSDRMGVYMDIILG